MNDKLREKAGGVAFQAPIPEGKTDHRRTQNTHSPQDSTFIDLSNQDSLLFPALYHLLIFIVVWMIKCERKYRVILSHPLPAWCSLFTGKARASRKRCYCRNASRRKSTREMISTKQIQTRCLTMLSRTGVFTDWAINNPQGREMTCAQKLVQNLGMGHRHTAITHLHFLTSKRIEEWKKGERLSWFLQTLEMKALGLEEETHQLWHFQPRPVGLLVQTCWLCTCMLLAPQESSWCLRGTSCVGWWQTSVKS